MGRRWWVAACCYIGFALTFVGVLFARCFYPLYIAEPISVVHPASQSSPVGDLACLVDQRIDPNTATWAELMRLPRVGESLAKRIVAYREQRQRLLYDSTDRPPAVFTCPEDLMGISGIGPGTLQLIRDHLRFPSAASQPVD